MRLAAIFAIAIAALLSTSTPAQAQVRWSAQRPDNPPAFGTDGNFRFVCRARVGRDWIPGRVADGATGCIVPDLQQSPPSPKSVAAFEWLHLPWGKLDRKCTQKTVTESCQCNPNAPKGIPGACVCAGFGGGTRLVTREECSPFTATWSGAYVLQDLQPNRSNENIVTAGAGEGAREYGICIAEWGGRTELGAIRDTRCFIPVSPKVEAPPSYKAILAPKAAR